MNQTTFSEGPTVPLLVEGMIDPPTLRQLFADLDTAATIINIREKSNPRDYAAADEITSASALERLLGGTSRAVQLRYHFDGHEWTDTILAMPPGFRVLRCRHE